jgi:hypothetical protein
MQRERSSAVLDSNTVIYATGGTAAATYPFWSQLISDGFQAVIAIAGVVVLGLTIYNKILEMKQRRRDLKDTK